MVGKQFRRLLQQSKSIYFLHLSLHFLFSNLCGFTGGDGIQSEHWLDIRTEANIITTIIMGTPKGGHSILTVLMVCSGLAKVALKHMI